MSITVTKYPKRTTTGGNVSKWVALHNPIIYELQRKDYTVLSVTKNGNLFPAFKNTIRVKLNSPVVSPDTITEGDFIYIKSGVYDGVYEVGSVTSQSEFALQASFKGNSTGGFVNLNTVRENYHLQVEILGVNDSGTNYYVLGSANITASPAGVMKVDVHEWIKEVADYKNEYNYTTLNVKDKNLSNGFNIRFIETWETEDENNIQESTIVDSARHFFVNAAKQISEQYGQNMAIYCPFPNELDANKAKFLSGFEVPTIFRGYPFDLQFIYSDNISPYIIYSISEQYDLNGGLVASDNEKLDVAGILFVNRLRIPPINASAKRINMYLQIIVSGVPDVERLYQSCYAESYADDYYECLTTPVIPDPPEELPIA